MTNGDLTGEPGKLIKKEQLVPEAAVLDDARATYHMLYQSASGLGDGKTKPTHELIAVRSDHLPLARRRTADGRQLAGRGTVGSADH